MDPCRLKMVSVQEPCKLNHGSVQKGKMIVIEITDCPALDGNHLSLIRHDLDCFQAAHDYLPGKGLIGNFCGLPSGFDTCAAHCPGTDDPPENQETQEEYVEASSNDFFDHRTLPYLRTGTRPTTKAPTVIFLVTFVTHFQWMAK